MARFPIGYGEVTGSRTSSIPAQRMITISFMRRSGTILNAYMDRSIAEVRALLEQYPREITKDWEELNALFLAALEM